MRRALDQLTERLGDDMSTWNWVGSTRCRYATSYPAAETWMLAGPPG